MGIKKLTKQLKLISHELSLHDKNLEDLENCKDIKKDLIHILHICSRACTFNNINVLRNAEPYLKMHAKYISTLTEMDRIKGKFANCDDNDTSNKR